MTKSIEALLGEELSLPRDSWRELESRLQSEPASPIFKPALAGVAGLALLAISLIWWLPSRPVDAEALANLNALLISNGQPEIITVADTDANGINATLDQRGNALWLVLEVAADSSGGSGGEQLFKLLLLQQEAG